MGTEIPPANILDICRLCSSSDGDKIPIFTDEEEDQARESLSYRIKTCVSVTVCNDDTLSTLICEVCFDHVTTWFQFKKQCEQAQEKQKKWHRSSILTITGGAPIKSEPIEIVEEDGEVQELSVQDWVIKQEDFDISDDDGVNRGGLWGHHGPVSPPRVSKHEPTALCVVNNTDTESPSDDAIETINLEVPTPKKKYQCTTCDKFLSSRSGLVRHQQIHTRSELSCWRCLKPCSSVEDLSEHMRSHNVGSSMYCCTVCQKDCHKEGRLRKHMIKCAPAVMLSLARHICMACKKNFTNVTDLNAHKNKRHTKFCCICQESFTNCLNLESHMKTRHFKQTPPKHKRNSPYTCIICTSEFSHWYQLQLHKELHESNQISSSPPQLSAAPAVYKCPHCPVAFTMWKDYVAHKQAHSGPSTSSTPGASTASGSGAPTDVDKKPTVYMCTSCQVTFPRAQNLRHHRENVHSLYDSVEEVDMKPVKVDLTLKSEPGKAKTKPIPEHSCPICGKKFKFHALKRHMLSHNTEKPYSCPICNLRLKYKLSVQKHLFWKHEIQCELNNIEPDTVTQPTPDPAKKTVKSEEGREHLACQVCSKQFYTEETLITHVHVSHKNVYMAKCKFCSQVFHDAGAHKIHEKSHLKPDCKPLPGDGNFKCTVCPMTFGHYKSFRRHQINEAHFDLKYDDIKIKIFSCTSCHNSYNNGEALRIHRFKKHGIGSDPCESGTPLLKCRVCKKNFVRPKALETHLLKKHSVSFSPKNHPVTLRCNICNKLFDKAAALHAHKGWHSRRENDSSCSGNPANSVGSREQRTCHICKKEFLTYDAFKIHFAFHTWDEKTSNTNNPGVKPEAGTSFTHNMKTTALKMEQVPNLPTVKKRLGRPPNKPKLKSELASEISPEKINHEIVTKRPANVKSELKGKQFLDKGGKQGYLNCSKCDLLFENKRSLSIHLGWHFRVPPCQYCRKTFSRAGFLQEHLLTCNQRKIVEAKLAKKDTVSAKPVKGKCDHCGKTFLRLGNLSKHILVCKQRNNSTTPSEKEVSFAGGKRAKRERKRSAPSVKAPPAIAMPKPQVKSTKLFTCDVCSRQFKLFRSMLTHKIWHTRHAKSAAEKVSAVLPPTEKESQTVTKPFSCDFCSESFTNKKAFGTHRNMHVRKLARSGPKRATLEKVYTCNSCPESFNSYAKLNRHHQKHIREIFPTVRPEGKVVKRGRRKKTKLQPPLDVAEVEAGIEDPVEELVTVEVMEPTTFTSEMAN